eukprot:TRINITY_DN75799_c0_g1_i1.p1 TRINITY_DN75799_c0_g1~~TRINITY_DN75799_c0_g1_i1.p1  ORF type:complete len:102 (+),score=4.61 TRINITY_DN75799_c0_g1_i1:20-325(+)
MKVCPIRLNVIIDSPLVQQAVLLFGEAFHHFDGNWEHNGRILLSGDRVQSLQISELESSVGLGDNISSFFKSSGGSLFSFCSNYLSLGLSCSLSLCSHGSL